MPDTQPAAGDGERAALLELALSAARAGVWSRRLDSTWVDLTESLAALFGLPPDRRRIEQDALYERIYRDDAGAVRRILGRDTESHAEIALDFRMHVSEDALRWFHFRGRVASSDSGEPARLVGIVADITERRSLDLQARQAEKMEALGQLAGGVAHDFNNLLTAIIGYGRFALESARSSDQRRDLDEIVKAAGRAAALTKQLLAFSRRQAVETVEVDLNLLIVDMVSMLRRMIGEDLELATTLAAGLPHVRADRSQLEQVVLNLVTNARDACGPGGRIRIATEAVDLDASSTVLVPGLTRGAYVTLQVIDNGVGITEDTRGRLFEPFFTTKPRAQGSGLGLATVYGIVVQCGGTIAVDSTPGAGSTFTVYLPRQRQTVASAGPAPVSTPPSGGRTVLLVEDEQAVRELVRIILERAGHRVIEAATPEEAVARFTEAPAIDMLLTDVVMPGMSGFDLFHMLSDRLPALRVLFISGYTDYAMFDPTIAARGAAFLEKPFTAEALITKVKQVIGAP